MTKLTKDQAIEIYESNLSAKELALIFSVSESSVYQIWSGTTYRKFTRLVPVRKKYKNCCLIPHHKIINIFNAPTNYTYQYLADMYNVSVTSVFYIRNKIRHVDIIDNYLDKDNIICQ